MYGFQNRQYYRPNHQAIARAQEKLQQNALSTEDILDDDDLVGDLKQPTFSQLTSYLSNEHVFKLIDFITKEPISNEHKIGYKFPYTACEILASDNSQILDKMFEEKFVDEDKSNILEENDTEKLNKNERSDSLNEISSEETKQPVDEIKQPVDETKQPVDETKQPVDETKQPVDETKQPVDETKQPVDETKQAVEEIKQSVEEIKQSVEETSVTTQIFPNPEGQQEDINTNTSEKTNEETPKIINQDEETHEDSNLNNQDMNVDRNYENKYTDHDNHDIKEDNSNNVSKNLKKTIKYEMLDYFFNFLRSDCELNFVLCGYFLKVFNHLQLNKGSILQKYIFTMNSDVINNIMRHLNRKSICDIVLKLLFSTQSECNTTERKEEIILNIIKTFNPNNIELCNNICDLLLEILVNKSTFNIVLRKKNILFKLHALVNEHINNNSINKDLIRVLNKFNENFLKEVHGVATVSQLCNNYDSNFSIPNFNFEEETGIFSKTSAATEEFDLNNYSFIFDILYESFEVVIRDFINNNENEVYAENTLKTKHKILGLTKIFQLDYIKEIFEIVINSESINLSHPKLNEIIEITISSNVFQKMIEYFKMHQWNNMYQKSFESVINLLLNKYTNKNLTKNFFFDCKFLEFITDNIFNKKFQYESGKEINDGLFSFLLESAYNISRSDNLYLNEVLLENILWRNFIDRFVNPLKDRLAKGMVFPQENPFHKPSMENTQCENSYMNKETINEIIKISTQQFREANESRERKVSDIVEDKSHNRSILNEDAMNDAERSDYYDNKYWKQDIGDINFEIS